MAKFLSEFKEFAMRGNVIDLAVGVVIGTAFNKIVTSLVNDVLMPPIGAILGGVDFSGLKVMMGEASLNYGAFIQSVVDFLIIAFTIFMVVKAMNKLQKPKPAETGPAPVPEDVKLLTEIRDLLKK
jgi:large conductance mechanosensitive channel